MYMYVGFPIMPFHSILFLTETSLSVLVCVIFATSYGFASANDGKTHLLFIPLWEIDELFWETAQFRFPWEQVLSF